MSLGATREKIDALEECRSAIMRLKMALMSLEAAEAHSSLANTKIEFEVARKNNGPTASKELLDLANAIGASPEFATLLVQTATHRVEDSIAKLSATQVKLNAIL